MIYVESSASVTIATILSSCPTTELVKDMTTNITWTYSGGAWGVYSPSGAQGPQGATGYQGPQGAQGLTGATGAQGSQGSQGNTGATGAQGSQGVQGAVGATGAQGNQGNQGVTGATGAQGSTGATGAQGVQGAVGPQGAQGASIQGPQGATGAQGATGSTGPQGAQGASVQGPQGATGAQGATGSQGASGSVGSTYVATSVSPVTMGTGTKSFTIAAGLSFTIDQRVVMAYSTTKYMYGRVTSYSGTTLQVSVDFTTDTSVSYSSWTINLMGERGTILAATSSTSTSIGTGAKTLTATTLCSFVPGQRVAVAYNGSNYMVGVITTYIPTTGSFQFTADTAVGSGTYTSWSISITGPSGPQGAQGVQGVQGVQGATGAQGSQGASGSNGSQGAQGSTGSQGAQGTSIMNITISTSAPSGSGNEGDIWVVVPA